MTPDLFADTDESVIAEMLSWHSPRFDVPIRERFPVGTPVGDALVAERRAKQ